MNHSFPIMRDHQAVKFSQCGAPSVSSQNVAPASAFRLVSLTGVVEHPEKAGIHSISVSPDETSMNECVSWTGSWMGVFNNAETRTWAVTGDYFGMSQIHYAILSEQENGRNALVVGTSHRSVLRELTRLGMRPSVNWPIALPQLTTGSAAFSLRLSRETTTTGVEILNHDEVIYCNRDSIWIERRPQPSLPNSYQQLLEQGIDSATKIAQQTLTSSGRVPQFWLSGGKDSRTILAMFIGAGIEKDWRYLTTGAGTTSQGAVSEILDGDLRIASGIVEHFGLKWYSPLEGYNQLLSFEESLSVWQDFRGGTSFNLPQHKSVRRNTNELRVTGAGGEVYRRYFGSATTRNYPEWWKNAGKTNETIFDDLLSLYPRMNHPWGLNASIYTASQEKFAYSLYSQGSTDVVDSLDNTYIDYRNRAHAGVAEQQAFEDAILISPLVRPEFLMANSFLSRTEQSAGKLLYDIIEIVCPKLNAFPFSSGAWDSEALRISDAAIQKDELSGTAALADREVLRKSPPYNVPSRGGSSAYSFIESAEQYVDATIDEISATATYDLGREVWNSVLDRAARAADLDNSAMLRMASKVATIRDSVNPSIYSGTTLSVDVISSSLKMTDTDVVRFGQQRQRVSLSGILAYFVRNNEDNYAKVHLNEVPDSCEFACYLYKDGTLIDQVWYKPVPEWEFELEASSPDESYRVAVFLRPIGAPQAQRVIHAKLTT